MDGPTDDDPVGIPESAYFVAFVRVGQPVFCVIDCLVCQVWKIGLQR